MRQQPPYSIAADESHRASVASDYCLDCGGRVLIETDGNGRLVELNPRTQRIHRCPWDRYPMHVASAGLAGEEGGR